MNINKIAKKVFEIESKEIINLSNNLTSDFEDAVNAIFYNNILQDSVETIIYS